MPPKDKSGLYLLIRTFAIILKIKSVLHLLFHPICPLQTVSENIEAANRSYFSPKSGIGTNKGRKSLLLASFMQTEIAWLSPFFCWIQTRKFC